MSHGLSVEWVTSEQGWFGLESEWRQLYDALPHATPFQSPDWLLPWWSAFREEKQLAVVIVRRVRQLVGLLPLYLNRRDSTRELLCIGTGNTDHLDLIAAPDALDVGLAVLSAVAARRDEFDVLDWQELPANSVLLRPELRREWQQLQFSPDVTQHSPCPMLALPERSAALPLSKSLRRGIEYSRRKAEQLGSFQRLDTDAETLESSFAALVQLHGARRSTQGDHGALHDPVACAFHRDVVERTLRSGILRMFQLRLDAHTLAVYYGFERGAVAYNYLSGFDPEFERLSPGSLLVAEAIELARAGGCRSFDFLRGDEPYKYRWGAINQPNYRCVVRP